MEENNHFSLVAGYNLSIQLSMGWPSPPQGHTADLCSACLRGSPGPFLQSCFPFIQCPAFNAEWGYSTTDAELPKCLCWNFTRSLPVPFFCMSRSLWIAAFQHMLNFHPENWLKVLSIPSSTPLMKKVSTDIICNTDLLFFPLKNTDSSDASWGQSPWWYELLSWHRSQ